MKTKKQMKMYYFTWILLTVLFNIVVFAVTNAEKRNTVVYWISYAVIMAALAAELVSTRNAVKAEEEGKYSYKIPVLTAGTQFLIFTIIAATLFLSVPSMPSWLGMLLCIAFCAMNLSLIRHAQSPVSEGRDIALELEAGLEAKRAAKAAGIEARQAQRDEEAAARRAAKEEKKKAEEAAAKAEASAPRYVKYGTGKEDRKNRR